MKHAPSKLERRERLERLDDYLSANLPEAEVPEYEQALFAAAAEGACDELAFLDSLQRQAAFVVARGGFSGGTTRAEIDRLLASDFKVHYDELQPGAPVRVKPWADGVDLVIFRLDVDARGYDEIDVDVTTGEGELIKTFRDVQSAPEDGALYAVCEERLARISFGRGRIISRVTGVSRSDSARGRQLIALFDTEPLPR